MKPTSTVVSDCGTRLIVRILEIGIIVLLPWNSRNVIDGSIISHILIGNILIDHILIGPILIGQNLIDMHHNISMINKNHRSNRSRWPRWISSSLSCCHRLRRTLEFILLAFFNKGLVNDFLYWNCKLQITVNIYNHNALINMCQLLLTSGSMKYLALTRNLRNSSALRSDALYIFSFPAISESRRR